MLPAIEVACAEPDPAGGAPRPFGGDPNLLPTGPPVADTVRTSWANGKSGAATWSDFFCPVTVAEDLDDLRGPIRGRHRLPRDLDPHGRTCYDLADIWARRRLTITVLTAAAPPDELHTWIDRDTLLTCWATLYLDPATRADWDRRHPALARGTRPPHQSSSPAEGTGHLLS